MNFRASGSYLPSDPYRGVVLVLLAMALIGAIGSLAGNAMVANPLLLDATVTLVIAVGILTGVAVAQALRAKPSQSMEATASAPGPEPAQAGTEQAPAPAEVRGPETVGLCSADRTGSQGCTRTSHGRLVSKRGGVDRRREQCSNSPVFASWSPGGKQRGGFQNADAATPGRDCRLVR